MVERPSLPYKPSAKVEPIESADGHYSLKVGVCWLAGHGPGGDFIRERKRGLLAATVEFAP
jgi:hypothetical protein